MIVAKLTNKKPGIFTLMMGDTHLYETHLKQAATQEMRIPFESPRLELVKEVRDIADLANLSFEDFKLSSYSSYPSIKAIMST